jgi:peptide/nickel transport system permease protein
VKRASKDEAVTVPFGSSGGRPQTLLGAALRRFRRHRLALFGVVLITVLVLAAIFAPLLSPYGPTKTNLPVKLSPPTFAHPFGTDHFGRDMFSRMLFGARISLRVGLSVVVLAGLLGTPIGLIAGYFGGRTDNLLMRLMDAFLTFPPLLLAVAIIGTLGSEVRNVILALGLVYLPIFARLARGSTLSVREQLYVSAAVSIGAGGGRVLLRHILPNVVAPIVVQAAVIFSRAVLVEASLRFLGLGVQPPNPSWGRDLNEARRFLDEAWWLVTFPTVMIGLSVLSMNFVGDGLRDALDPRSNR